jgi:hypothetical protein
VECYIVVFSVTEEEVMDKLFVRWLHGKRWHEMTPKQYANWLRLVDEAEELE